MLSFLKSTFSLKDENSDKLNSSKNIPAPKNESTKVSNTLENNKVTIKNILDNFSDLIIREVKITNNCSC